MASITSVLGLFGITSQSNTIVNQLAVNNSLFLLENESKEYFDILDNNNTDNLFIKINIKYDIAQHSKYVQNCTNMLRFQSDTLRELDKKILLTIALSITAMFLSFIPFVGLFGSIVSLYSCYLYAERAKAEVEYRESLNLLVAICNWSLGPNEDDRLNSAQELKTNEFIRQMMTCLYPVLDAQQIRDLIADDIEQLFVNELDEYDRTNGDYNDIARSKRSSEFLRCIYGHNKGNAEDAINAVISIYPDLRDSTIEGLKQLKQWWNNETAAPTSLSSSI